MNKDWSNYDIKKYYINYCYNNEKMEANYFYSQGFLNTIYFKTEKDAQYIIDNYSEELKKG